MSRRPAAQKKKSIQRGLRMQILAWCALLSSLMLIGSTFAWYSVVVREAESKEANVMQPYYLTLLNPSETAGLQLSVGSLMPGRKRQIVFCVSNDDNEEKINMGGADFDYSMELIYTENMALNYKVYDLEQAEEEAEGSIVAEDYVIIDGVGVPRLTYWNIKGEALDKVDVSSTRHGEVGLSAAVNEVVNKGKYWQYTQNSEEENLHLSSSTNGDGYDSQYFLLEIEWDVNEISNFDKYEKETDMIYILVKALQPEPTKK